MSNITIIGSSGAGKTVFISVLAERFSDRFLPKNPRTKRYTAEIYGDLVDEQRWPDSTGAGQIKDLAWELVLPGCGSAEITVLDTPGQDIQDIYSDDEATPRQKNLKSRIDGSDILVLFVNLVDIINGKTYRERESLKSFIRFAAMDVLSRNSITRVAILFSQHDQLKSLLAQQGMDTNNVREVVNKYIPELNHEIGKVPSTRVYLGFVASVADVETRWDPQREVSVVVPAKNFRTLGLTGFIDKLDVFVCNVQKEKRKAEEERKKQDRADQENSLLKERVEKELTDRYSLLLREKNDSGKIALQWLKELIDKVNQAPISGFSVFFNSCLERIGVELKEDTQYNQKLADEYDSNLRFGSAVLAIPLGLSVYLIFRLWEGGGRVMPFIWFLVCVKIPWWIFYIIGSCFSPKNERESLIAIKSDLLKIFEKKRGD